MRKFTILIAVLGLSVGWICFHLRENSSRDDASTSVDRQSDEVGQVASESRATVRDSRTSRHIAPRPFSGQSSFASSKAADLTEAIRLALMSDDTAIRLNALTNLVPELVDCDSAAAAKLVESLPTGESREELRSALIRAWATKDAASAFAWAAQLSDVDERNSALAGIVYRIAETTPADAIAVAQRYGLDNGDGEVLASLAMQWAGRNLNSALDWATRQPAGNSRDQMITRIAFVQAENSPRDAAELIVKEIPPGAAQQEAAISVLHQWLLQDLQAARAWVDQFPDSPLKQRAEAELENGARFLAADQTSAPD